MLAIFCALLFFRPFISSLAFPLADAGLNAFILSLLIILVGVRRPLRSANVRPLILPSAFFLSLLALSSVSTPGFAGNLKEFVNFIACVGLLLTVAALEKNEKRTVLKALLLSATVIAACSFYQFLFGFRHIAAHLSRIGGGSDFARDYLNSRRAFFPFITPNLLGGYLAMMLPLTFCFKRTRWLAAAIAAALLLTHSIGALISLAAGLIFFLTLSRGNARRVASYLLCGLFLVSCAMFFIRAGGRAHLLPIFSSVMRIEYWQETWRLMRSAPITGVGLGNFNLAHSRYAHNSFLQLAASAGIFALAGFVWLAAAAVRALLEREPESKERRLLICAACVIFLTHNLIDFSFFLPETAMLWWVILGL
jgi:O-antigen ligase